MLVECGTEVVLKTLDSHTTIGDIRLSSIVIGELGLLLDKEILGTKDVVRVEDPVVLVVVLLEDGPIVLVRQDLEAELDNHINVLGVVLCRIENINIVDIVIVQRIEFAGDGEINNIGVVLPVTRALAGHSKTGCVLVVVGIDIGKRYKLIQFTFCILNRKILRLTKDSIFLRKDKHRICKVILLSTEDLVRHVDAVVVEDIDVNLVPTNYQTIATSLLVSLVTMSFSSCICVRS